MNLDRAIKDAFNPKQPEKLFPVFKKKGKSRDSFRYPQGFKIDGNRIFLPKRAGHAQLAGQANGAVMPSATGTSRLAA